MIFTVRLTRRILFFLLILVCQVGLSKGFLQENPIIFGTDKDIQEEFIPLGFNENKRFSYLRKLFSDGTGCNYWSFNILNLSNDKVIKQIETSPDGCYLDEKESLEKQFMKKIETELQNHGITKHEEIKIKPFPFVSSSQEFNICFSEKTKKTKQEVTIKTSKKLIAYNKQGASKIIGMFEEVEFGGVFQIFNPKIEGYFKNPKSNQLAVIVSYAVRGTDGPPNFRRVKVFGSTLKIKDGVKVNDICSQIISKLTPQTKVTTPKSAEIAKQELDTNLPKNAEVIKAEKAEPIKSAKGSTSLILLASTLGLLGWRFKNIM